MSESKLPRGFRWRTVRSGWRFWYELLDENEGLITSFEYPQMSELIDLFDFPDDVREEIFRVAKTLSDERKKDKGKL